MKVARFEPWHCASCGYAMDAASEIFGDALPDEGDIALCIRCAEMHILDNRRWRSLTDDELIDLPLDDKQRISEVQLSIRARNKRD